MKKLTRRGVLGYLSALAAAPVVAATAKAAELPGMPGQTAEWAVRTDVDGPFTNRHGKPCAFEPFESKDAFATDSWIDDLEVGGPGLFKAKTFSLKLKVDD